MALSSWLKGRSFVGHVHHARVLVSYSRGYVPDAVRRVATTRVTDLCLHHPTAQSEATMCMLTSMMMLTQTPLSFYRSAPGLF